MLLMRENNAKFGEPKNDFSNSYLLGDDQYTKNREGIFIPLNNCKGSKKQQPITMNTNTIKDEVALVEKYTDIHVNNGKRVTAAGEEKCQHCEKNYGHCIDKLTDLSPEKW